jgi:Transposase
MTKPYSLDLRDRAVALVVAGETVRFVAATLRVGVSSVVKWSQRFRATGTAAPRKMGGHLAARSDWRTPGVASAADLPRAGYDLARAGRRTGRAGRQGELSNGLELRSSREGQL